LGASLPLINREGRAIATRFFTKPISLPTKRAQTFGDVPGAASVLASKTVPKVDFNQLIKPY